MSEAPNRNQVVGSLKEMLESLRKAPPKEKHCQHCGLLLAHVHARFWLDDFEHSWEMPLPYCLSCNPEIGDRRTFAA